MNRLTVHAKKQQQTKCFSNMIIAKTIETPLQVWKDGERQRNADGTWATTPAYKINGIDGDRIVVQSLGIYEKIPDPEELARLEEKWNSFEWQNGNSSDKFLRGLLPRGLRPF